MNKFFFPARGYLLIQYVIVQNNQFIAIINREIYSNNISRERLDKFKNFELQVDISNKP